MKTYIYKSRKKEELYLYIAQKDDFSKIPQALFDAMGKDPQFVMELELSSERKLAREDINQVINNIKTQGFHVQMPPMANTPNEFSSKNKKVH